MISTDKTPDSNDTVSNDPVSNDQVDKKELIHIAVRAALDRKAEDLKVLYLGEISDFTDHFVICSGINERQVQAIADAMLDRLRSAGLRPLHIEGKNRGTWILLDYGGELVVHVFLDETRQYFNLERLWADAPDETTRYTDDSLLTSRPSA